MNYQQIMQTVDFAILSKTMSGNLYRITQLNKFVICEFNQSILKYDFHSKL